MDMGRGVSDHFILLPCGRYAGKQTVCSRSRHRALIDVHQYLLISVRIQDQLKDYLAYIENHRVKGVFVFIALYCLCTMLLLPGTVALYGLSYLLNLNANSSPYSFFLGFILSIGAGIIFRPFPLAIVSVLTGAALGLTISFLIGRYLFRDLVEKYLLQRDRRWQMVDRAVEFYGWRIVFMLRIVPVFPFGASNYLLSATGIPVSCELTYPCLSSYDS
jgi:uncharacterized membrane protein YdjX (TVP38/TMEM64 family)